jgi:hypothetical protein
MPLGFTDLMGNQSSAAALSAALMRRILPPPIDYGGGGGGVTANDILGQFGPVVTGPPLAPAPPRGLGQLGPSVTAPPISGGGLGSIDRTGPLGGPYYRGPMANLNPTLGEVTVGILPPGMGSQSAGYGHHAQQRADMIRQMVRMEDQQSPSFAPASDYVDPSIPYEGYGLPGQIGPSPFATRTPEGRYNRAEQATEWTGPNYMPFDTSWSRRKPRVDPTATPYQEQGPFPGSLDVDPLRALVIAMMNPRRFYTE